MEISVVKLHTSTKEKLDEFIKLFKDYANQTNRFDEFFKENTGVDLGKKDKELSYNNAMLLAVEIAKKELQKANNQLVAKKNLVSGKGGKKDLGIKVSRGDGAKERLGKFVESIVIHNRKLNKTNGNSANKSIYINGTILRREGGFNSILVDKFMNNEFAIKVGSSFMTYSQIEKEMQDFDLNKNFNSLLRGNLKSNEISQEILDIVKANMI